MFKTFTQVSAVMGLALGASFVTPSQPVQAAGWGSSDCGGLNEKTCISVWPSKRCDAGLVEKKQRGRNICVRPSSPGDRTGGCGGLNERTCISVLPSKRCDAGLIEVKQPGRNICIKDELGADRTPNCGGIGQASCWSLKASEWCDPGLLYKPGGLPGRGRCEAADENDMIQYTRAVASRFNALGPNNEATKLRNCLIAPTRLARLKAQMEASDTNGTNSIIRECNVDIEELQRVAAYVLQTPGNSAARNLGLNTVSNSDDWDDNLDGKMRLTFELTYGATAGSKGGSNTIGYAIPLHKKPLGSRWYRHNDEYDGGIDLGFGTDLLIGFGFPGVPGGDLVTEEGKSGVLAVGALGKLGMATRVTRDGRRPMWAIFGGVGLGVTAAMYDYENQFLIDK